MEFDVDDAGEATETEVQQDADTVHAHSAATYLIHSNEIHRADDFC